MQIASLLAKGRDLFLVTSSRSSLLLMPVSWMLLGAAALAALAPSWFGAERASWVLPASWGVMLLVIVAIARGAVNYVNARSFWTGSGRSAIKVSEEQRDALVEDIRKVIAQLTIDDFFDKKKQQIDEAVWIAENRLRDAYKTAGELRGEMKIELKKIASDVLSESEIAPVKKRVDSEIEDGLKRVRDKFDEFLSDLELRVRSVVDNEVSTAVGKTSIDHRLESLVHGQFVEIERSIMQFLGQQVRRANVYLYLGVTIGLAGVLLFSFYFLSIPSQPNVYVLLSRSGLLIAIEVFAMFFLRLYKASLTEISFFQNELTTIRSKRAGLNAAIQIAAQHDYKPLVDAVAALVSLDRNSILEKGQTTKDLEERRLHSNEEVELVRAVSEVIRAARKK